MTNTALAREILGNDFISPEEIVVARGLTYTSEQLEKFEQTIPDKNTLEWLRRNDDALIAGPPQEMSILDIRKIECSYFKNKQGGWYAEPSEIFAHDEKVSCCWLMLRKDIVPNSTIKTWSEQQKLVSDLERVPTAVEMVWSITTYKAVRGIFLLSNVYARVSSVDSGGHHVSVGFCDRGGVGVAYWDDRNDGSICLGISAARTF